MSIEYTTLSLEKPLAYNTENRQLILSIVETFYQVTNDREFQKFHTNNIIERLDHITLMERNYIYPSIINELCFSEFSHRTSKYDTWKIAKDIFSKMIQLNQSCNLFKLTTYSEY